MPQKGYNAKLYYKVGGVAGGGSFEELDIIKDVSSPMSRDKADATTRAEGEFKVGTGMQIDATCNFMLRHQPAHAGYQAIRDAFFAGEVIGIRVLDAVGGEGIEADMEVFKFERDESELIWVSVEIGPAPSDTPPEYIGAS